MKTVKLGRSGLEARRVGLRCVGMKIGILWMVSAIAFTTVACSAENTPVAEEVILPTAEVQSDDQTPAAENETRSADPTPTAQSDEDGNEEFEEESEEESEIEDAPEEIEPIEPEPTAEVFDNRTAVFNLYHESFQTAVREQEIDDLYNTFIERNIPLNAVNKPQATMSANTPAGWVSFFSGKDYELVLDEPDVIIAGQGGLAIAHFDEMINDQLFSTGTDMFLSLNTADGWRLATMNVTLVPASSADFSAEPLVQDPLDVVSTVQSAVAEKNRELWETVVFRPQIPVFKIVEPPSTPIAISDFAAGDFFAEIEGSSGTLTLELNNIQSEIIDDYLAYVTAEYVFLEDESVIEDGSQLWTLIGTPADGWQITAMVWSAN